MKSKVLSLILAITLLCGIMVPTAAFADVEKGSKIVLLKDDFTKGVNGYVMSSEQTLPGKSYSAQCIGGTKGQTVPKSYYTIVPTIDLAEPFTFEFQYWAKSGVKSFFSFESGTDLLTTSETGSVYLNGSVVSNVTAPFEAWNTVLFNYDGTQYGVYLNGILLGDKFTLDAIGVNFRIGTAEQNFSGLDYTQLCFDEIYAYEGAYEPEVSDEPEEPEEPTTTVLFDDFEDSSITTAKMTFKNHNGKWLADPAFGDDDKALVLSVSEMSLSDETTVDVYQKDTTLYSDDKVTFEVDIFKDNTSKPVSVSVKYHPVGYEDNILGSFTFAKFMDNGTITSQDYGVKEDGKNGVIYPTIATYAPNRWYKVAATYDKATQTMNVYINGELLLEGAKFPYDLDKIGAEFKISETHTPYDGVVPASLLAVDNYRISSEAYDTTGETAKVTYDALDSNTIYVDDAYSKTVANVKDLISSGDATIKFYADDTYANELADTETITATTVLVATSPNETVREYYTFKAKDTIELTKNSTTGLATASVYLTEGYTENHMLVIAAYSEDNELLAVTVNNDLSTDALASANVSLKDAALIKAFVWTDDNQPTEIIKKTLE